MTQACRVNYRPHAEQKFELDLIVRDISEADFDAIASRLEQPKVKLGSIEVIRGLHPDCGRTVLLRDASRWVVLVENAAALDFTRAERMAGIGHG